MIVTCPVCGGSGETWPGLTGTTVGMVRCRACGGSGTQDSDALTKGVVALSDQRIQIEEELDRWISTAMLTNMPLEQRVRNLVDWALRARAAIDKTILELNLL